LLSDALPAEPRAVRFAQFTDSHLFADVQATHCGANVLANLRQVLAALAQDHTLDFLVFTGDLTQDHSALSYQHFADAVRVANIQCPVYFVSGNHDEPELLAHYLTGSPFCADTWLELGPWQLWLLASKSSSPAGVITEQALAKFSTQITAEKFQFVLLHHHPLDVGYFIDRHGLQNQQALWQVLRQYPNVKGVACGHVHRALTITEPDSGITLYTCPATSIQFDPEFDGVKALSQAPGYRRFCLHLDGSIDSEVVMLAAQ
jgi:3',5'-cyclic-AMP phosphodiesterase